MNKYYTSSIILFIIGIVLLALSVAIGQATVGLLIFIPIFYGGGILAFTGFICIIVGILLAFYGFIKKFEIIEGIEKGKELVWREKPRVKKRYGGVVLLGPIPIIFGSDKKMALLMIILTIILIITVFILFYWLSSSFIR